MGNLYYLAEVCLIVNEKTPDINLIRVLGYSMDFS